MSTLVQRSVLGSSGYPLDQIRIAGIAARGFHGVLESERLAGQDFSADVTLYLDTRAAAHGDDLTETVNYALVAQDVADILSGAPVNLIETVAEQIAAAVLARPSVISVDVTVHKPQAPIPVPFADVVVVIHRDRINAPVVASPVDAAPVLDAAAPVDAAPADAVPDDATETEDIEQVEEVESFSAMEAVEAGDSEPEPEAARVEEVAAPQWRAPVPVVGTGLPVVISRPASVSSTPLDAPLDAPLTAPLDAPLDAPFDGPLDAPLEDESAPVPEVGPVPPPPVAEPAPITTDLRFDATVVLPPLDEQVLAEQARLSEQSRRPEVFGMADISAGRAPDVLLDAASSVSPTSPDGAADPHALGSEPSSVETAVLEPVAFEPAEFETAVLEPVEFEPAEFETAVLEPVEFEPDAAETVVLEPVTGEHAADEYLAGEHAADEYPAGEHAAAEDASDDLAAVPGLHAADPTDQDLTDEDPADEDPADEDPTDDAGSPDDTTVVPRAFDRMDAAPAEPVEVVIALGANLGDAQDTLRRAVFGLGAVSALTITTVGPLARTAAVGGPEQPDFLNTVVLATTTLSPRDLLHVCQSIEADHGRERLEHWGPRTLDIDIIAYGALVHSSDDLEVPHPRANERAFVLAPWAHVTPDAVLPGLGGGPVGALAATAPDRDGIRWLALDWLQESEPAAQAPASIPPSPSAQPVTSGIPTVVPPAPPA